MKLIEHFDTFLRDVVNLNQSRIDLLEERAEAIETFLSNSDFKPRIWRYSRQGSWAVKTIIKPPSGKDFDADSLVFVDAVDGWTPKDYIEDLYRVFRGSDRYKALVRRGTRCVTIDYANDFHLDLVICIRLKNGNYVWLVVCNRSTDQYELTDGEGFADWFAGRNGVTGGSVLRKVARLIKYLRDIKGTFSAKSVLLVTLLGLMVEDWHKEVRDHYYPDVPTGLKTIVGLLDDWLQARPSMPTVSNPALPSEDFNRHWDQDKYETFRDKIHQYREWIDDAYNETDRDESIAKWRRVFGDDFAKGEVVGRAAGVAASVLQVAKAASSDLLAAVRSWGPGILQRIPANLPHVSPPPWPRGGQMRVEVRATMHSYERGPVIRAIASGDILPKDASLKFTAHVSSGIPDGWQVKWRVVNSGEEAVRLNCLRGGFEPSNDARNGRWERTSYLGAHWVEAFVINTRSGAYAGRSERFFIVVSHEHYGTGRNVA